MEDRSEMLNIFWLRKVFYLVGVSALLLNSKDSDPRLLFFYFLLVASCKVFDEFVELDQLEALTDMKTFHGIGEKSVKNGRKTVLFRFIQQSFEQKQTYLCDAKVLVLNYWY